MSPGASAAASITASAERDAASPDRARESAAPVAMLEPMSPIASRRTGSDSVPTLSPEDLPPRSAMPSPSPSPSPSRMATLAGSVASALSAAGSVAAQGATRTQEAVTHAAQSLWTLSDLRTMLQPHADDPAFLALLRGPATAQERDFNLARCDALLDRLDEVIRAADGIERPFRDTLLKDIATIQRAIQPLQHGTSASSRACKALMNLVHLWPIVVPSPLLANQAKTFAYTVAAATKAVVGVAGTTLRPTADGFPLPFGGGELGRQFNEVHFYPALLNAIFLSVELSKRSRFDTVRHHAEAVDHSKVAHAGLAAAAGAVLIAPFVWGSIKRGAAQAAKAGANAVALGLEKVGCSGGADALRRRFTPGEVSQAVHQELSQLWRGLEDGRLALQRARRDFTDPDSGMELTRTLNSQCTHLLGSIAQCARRLDEAFHLSEGAAPSGGIPRAPSANPDFASKLALTLFAAGVTGTTVYLIQPDPIGTVDLAADSLVVSAVMAQSAWNSQSTRQDAMERFKGMAATSMVMAIALSVDKLSKQFTPKGLIESSDAAPYYASIVMTAMAMTMPGPVARGAELAMNWAGGQAAALGRTVAQVFRGPDGQMLATHTPTSPEDLQRHVAETSRYVASLTPAQRDDYVALAGESIRAAINEVGQAASDPAPRRSSVSIEELPPETP